MILLALLALAVLGYLVFAPSHLTLAEEERLLREYFRKKDAAERRGERWPP